MTPVIIYTKHSHNINILHKIHFTNIFFCFIMNMFFIVRITIICWFILHIKNKYYIFK